MKNLEKSMLEVFLKENNLDYNKEFAFCMEDGSSYKGAFTKISEDIVLEYTPIMMYQNEDKPMLSSMLSMSIKSFLKSFFCSDIVIVEEKKIREALNIGAMRSDINSLMSITSKGIKRMIGREIEIDNEKVKEAKIEIFNILIDLYKDYLNLNIEKKDDTMIDLNEITDEILEEYPNMKASILKAREQAKTFGLNPMYMGILDTETNKMISLKEFLEKAKERGLE